METNQTIDITAEERETVLTLLQRHLPGVEAWTYGSRAKSTAHPQSDLDLVVFAPPEQSYKISDLREALEESNLPFRVDLFIWDEVPEQFHQEIKRDHVVLVKTIPVSVDVSWPEITLGELTQNFDDIRVPVKKSERRAGPYPYYGASGIVDHVDDFIFDGEYLLIAEDGENLRTRNTPIGFLADGKFWVNNHAHIVRGNSKANTNFLMYALATLDISGYLTGSTMPKLTQGNLNKIAISVPPLPEQRAIAHILGTLDDKIELNRRMNETLETMAQTLFKSWFVDFDPVRAKMTLKQHHSPPQHHSPLEGESNPQNGFGGGNNDQATDPDLPPPHQSSPDGSPSATPPQGGSDWTVERARAYLDRMDPEVAALFPDKLVDSELGEIPEGWTTILIKQLGRVVTGKTPSTKKPEFFGTEVPFLKIPDMHGRIYVIRTLISLSKEGAMSQAHKTVPAGSVSVSCIATPGLVVLNHRDTQTNQQINSIIPTDHMQSHFIFWSCRRLAAEVMLGGSGGSVFHNMNKTSFENLRLIYPGKEIARTYSKTVIQIHNRELSNEYETDTLAQIRDTLLPKLISGEIRLRENGETVEAAI